MNILLEGFILGLAYVMPIGAQNLYVIQSSMQNNTKRSLINTSYIILMDVSLALACFFGIGLVIKQAPGFAFILQSAGGIYLLRIGHSLIKANVELSNQQQDWTRNAFKRAFILTWFNPQALIDGSILLGSFNSKSGQDNFSFITGVTLASIAWFLALTTTVNIFKSKLNHKAMRTINIICGLVLIYFGLSLLTNIIVRFL